MHHPHRPDHRWVAAMSGSESTEFNRPLETPQPSTRTEATERRWSARRSIALDVVIYEKGLPVAASVSRNVGLEGMYVETTWHLFCTGTPLEAEFIVADGRGGRRYRLPVIVTHVSRHGFGLMFNIFDQNLFRALEAIVYSFNNTTKRNS